MFEKRLRLLPRASALLVCAIVLAGMPAELGAQNPGGKDIYEEQLRVHMDEQMPEAREIGLDGGGWFSYALFKYDDAVGRRFRTLRRSELRLWGSLNIRGAHRFYVRGVVGWDDWNSGDNPGDVTGDEYDDPRVERAWYQFHLGKLLSRQDLKRPPVDLKFKVGRAYSEIGTALVMSMPLDMIRFDVAVGDWEVMTFLGMTIRDSRNMIDDSEAVARDCNRCMWGVQLTYSGFDRHRPFVYYLRNIDHINPDPDDATQRYDYSSHYVGIGSEGSLRLGELLPPDLGDLRYQVELVGEWGKTYSEYVTDGGQDDICAMAFDLMIEYLFKTRTHPKVSFEYLFASGDTDRRASATSTVGGNLAGTTDHAFNAFGFRDTGLAFSPRISNINMYMLGGSFFPLEHIELFRKMEVGTKVFFYHKSADGPVSDVTGAVNNSRCLGWEWDIYCNWRITSDLAWTVRYGAFQPGAAFDQDDCRQFLYTGMTFSF